MSRVAKWKLEKTKLKVVFRLQFHATHIPLSGWDKLYISFIPSDSGKATAKTTKANVRNGTCKWADPIYETTRLLQDTKTRQFDEKFYKFVMAMGSSRSSILGETNINLADYADALKPYAVALPLSGCESGAILHVAVQLLTSKTGFREFEQQRELRERGLQTSSDQNFHDDSPNRKTSSSEENVNDQDKVDIRVRFKEESGEIALLEEEVGTNGDSTNGDTADSIGAFDGSSNTSGSLYAEKHDMSSTLENECIKSRISGNLGRFSLDQSPGTEKLDLSEHHQCSEGKNDWGHEWSPEYSAGSSLALAYEENSRLRESLEIAQSSIVELKLELSSLQNYANELSGETVKFAQQLASEITSGKELTNEVWELKSECLKLKDDLEWLKNSKANNPVINKAIFGADQYHSCQGFELKLLKGFLMMEEKIRDLINKACFGFHDRDLRFIHSDLKDLLSFLLGFKQEIGLEIPSFGLGSLKEPKNLKSIKDQLLGAGNDADMFQSENMLHYLIPSLVSHEADSVDATNAMKGKIFELLRELDDAKAERESLITKMEQMECYYETLVQELEENQRQLMEELQNIRNEHSTCIYTIAKTKAEMESLHHDMNNQLLRLTEGKCNVDSLNSDLERRASKAEAALRKAHLNYSSAVNQLQKDLELLSCQVTSMFETNENLIKQAIPDSFLTVHQGNSGFEKDPIEEMETCAAKVLLGQNHYTGVEKQQSSVGVFSEDLKRSINLQEGLYRKVEDEVCEVHFMNIYLDVYSSTLQETLEDASFEFRLMKGKTNDLSQKLELSIKSNQLLIMRLQSVMDEVHSLNEYKANCEAKCEEMNLQIETLGAKLGSATRENCLLVQKINEYEAMMTEFYSLKEKYQVCSSEKLYLENSLEKEVLLKENLQMETFSLHEELKSLKVKLDDLTSSKVNLQNMVNSLHNEMTFQKESFEPKLQSVAQDNCLLVQKITEYETLMKGYSSFREKYLACFAEKLELDSSLKKEALVNENFQVEISSLHEELKSLRIEFNDLASSKENLQNTVNFLHGNLRNLLSSYSKNHNKMSLLSEDTYKGLESTDLSACTMQLEELCHKACEKILHLMDENKSLSEDRDLAQVSLRKAEDDNLMVKKRFESNLCEMVGRLDMANDLVQKLQLEIETLTKRFSDGCDGEEKYMQQHSKLLSDIDRLEGELLLLSSKDRHFMEEIMVLGSVNEELVSCKETAEVLTKENEALVGCLREKNDESTRLSLEIDSVKENMQSVYDELLVTRALRDELESRVDDLNSLINEKECQLLNYDQLEAEVVHLKKLLSDLEGEKSSICRLLALSEERLDSVCQERASMAYLETQVFEMYEYSMAMEVGLIFTRTQYGGWIEDLIMQYNSKEMQLEELQNRCLTSETLLNRYLSVKERLAEENLRLLACIDSLKSELEVVTTENIILFEHKGSMMTQFEELKRTTMQMETFLEIDRNKNSMEIYKLEQMLVSYDDEINNLMLSKEELEVKFLVLKSKLDEQCHHITILENECDDEIKMVQSKCHELSQRLSKQILKTEEYKNLSIRLKDLKDSSDADCRQTQEKREHEGPPVIQESLRMAFIREQYESKLQEMSQQLSISNRQSEEMLLKLQDAIDEVENRKKYDASHLKINEELGKKILELEEELNLLLSEKREIQKAYDRVKAEKECSYISLECCKEEKLELEASLQKCKDEKSKLAVEFNLIKDLLEASKCTMHIRKEDRDGMYTSDGPFTENHDRNNENSEITCNGGTKKDMASENSSMINPADESQNELQQAKQDVLSRGDSRASELELANLREILNGNAIFCSQSLKSSLDILNDELQKIKLENTILPRDDKQHVSDSPGLQVELIQLQKANEELQSLFPLFNNFPVSGKALERVLTLEIELAEALQGKKKPTISSQSSFLKQHSDEEAIFRSFRDINELIKDTLDIKGRYSSVETELKEMQDRYSQLSLQFAEVEGERQKLMMTLKNVRSSRKNSSFNRSSSGSLGEHNSS